MEKPAKNPDSDLQKSQLIKTYTKVWTALRKAIQTQVQKGRCIEFPLAGKFLRIGDVVQYMPSLDFLGAGNFKFPENKLNVSPLGRTIGFKHTQVISLTAISAVCSIDREQTAWVLKCIFNMFVEKARAHKLCALSLGIGSLVATEDGCLQF